MYDPDQFKKEIEENNYKKKFLETLMSYSLPEHLRNTTWQKIPVKGFKRASQNFMFDDDTEESTLGDAIEDHGEDWKLGAEQMGAEHFRTRLWASLENHMHWARQSRKHMVVVTSHTHDPVVEMRQRDHPDQSVSEYVVQANSGSWTPDSYQRAHSSYIDIDFEPLSEAIQGVLPEGFWYPASVSYYEYPETSPRQSTKVPKPLPGRNFGGFDQALHPIQHELVVGESQSM
jgi:hypothetical protein